MSLSHLTALVIISRILTLAAGVIVSTFSVFSLTKVEQGYFFTFISLSAAQAVFELGITSLILHHFAHAFAGLNESLDGDELKQAKGVVNAVRTYSTRYFRIAALLFIGFIGVGGYVFFKYHRGVVR